jgi:MFS family permease
MDRGAFRSLTLAFAVSTVGDGLYLTALPLLAVAVSEDPLAVSAVASAAYLPWLLVGLVAGAVADRSDRPRLMAAVDVARAVAVGTLAFVVLADAMSLPVLVAVALALGVGETLFDSAAQAVIPAIVGRDTEALGRANGRFAALQIVGQDLAGPPVAALLFSVAAALPFVLDAASFVVSAAVLAPLARGRRLSGRPARGAASRRSLRRDVVVAARWLAGHRLLRTTSLYGALLNGVLLAGVAPLVVYARYELDIGGIGYGLLTTALGVGGALGAAAAARLQRHLTGDRLVEASAVIIAAAWATLALIPQAVAVGLALGLLSGAVVVAGVATSGLRQRLVPDELAGRVVAAVRMLSYGAAPLGALAGGALARTWGLRAPYAAGAVAVLAATALARPALRTWPPEPRAGQDPPAGARDEARLALQRPPTAPTTRPEPRACPTDGTTGRGGRGSTHVAEGMSSR